MLESMREQYFLSVAEVARIMNIGKSRCHDFVNGPECPFTVVKVGRLKRIPANSFFGWYDGFSGGTQPGKKKP